MNNSTQPFSLEDIYDILSGTSIDVRNIVVHVDGLAESGNNLDAIFGDNFAVILFLPNSDPQDPVGHFVTLSHLDSGLEYFDSFGREPPPQVVAFAAANGLPLAHNKKKLQDKRSDTCAKWCVARIFSLPIPLEDFVEIYSAHKTLRADVMVNNVFKLKKRR